MECRGAIVLCLSVFFPLSPPFPPGIRGSPFPERRLMTPFQPDVGVVADEFSARTVFFLSGLPSSTSSEFFLHFAG